MIAYLQLFFGEGVVSSEAAVLTSLQPGCH